MSPIPPLQKKELEVIFELLEVLQGSLDMNRTLGGAYPLLRKLVPADHGAMCVSRTEDPTQYDWTVAEMPINFFRSYPDIAQYDFVRLAVARKPNVVLCDTEMLPPEERAHIDRHPLVQYSRSNDMRVEQIMSVMFTMEPTWNGGLTLYRDKRRAFSERERSILQRLIPFFSSAMANCKRYGDLLLWSSMMETSLKVHRTAMLVFSTSMKWVGASDGIEQVLERCFGKTKGGRDGLPPLLLAKLNSLCQGSNLVAPPLPWIPPRSGAGVVVTFVPVVKEFGTYWMVLLDEVPEHWRAKLTPTELDVAVRVAQGWDSALVADDIGNRVKTTKTQLTSVFRKLGIEDRQTLTLHFRARK